MCVCVCVCILYCVYGLSFFGRGGFIFVFWFDYFLSVFRFFFFHFPTSFSFLSRILLPLFLPPFSHSLISHFSFLISHSFLSPMIHLPFHCYSSSSSSSSPSSLSSPSSSSSPSPPSLFLSPSPSPLILKRHAQKKIPLPLSTKKVSKLH